MLLTLKHNLNLLVAFQSFLFLLTLALPPFNKRRHNLYLAMFFLFQMLSESGGLIKDVTLYDPLTQQFSGVSPLVYFPGLPLNYLVFPFLYLYMVATTDSSFKLKARHLLHTLPFVAVAAFVAGEYRSKGIIALIMIAKYNNSLFIRQDYYNFRLLHLVQVFIYLSLCFWQLAVHRKRLTATSGPDNDVKFQWLRLFIYSLFGWGLLNMISLIVYNLNFAHYPISYIFAYGTYLAIMSVVFVRALVQREFLQPDRVQKISKYEKNRIGTKQLENYLNTILNYMDEQRPYLDPEISIKDFSDATGISSHTISQVLNTCLQQNFYDFINSYRIKVSRQLLSQTEKGEKTVTEILFESGFNSKSTFNSAFKKHTGMTPSEYKERETLSSLHMLPPA